MYFLTFFLFCVLANNVSCHKYSPDANKPEKSSSIDPLPQGTYINFRTLTKPFRMAKLNILWSKAQLRLTDTKLKSIFSDLKIHDKEELHWKKLKAEGLDEDGLKEADLRSKLTGIMSTYGLLHHFEDINNQTLHKEHNFQKTPHHKNLFSDERLNHLWAKAEVAGFTSEELQALKEEFDHHQDTVDQYYSLLNEPMVASQGKKHENSVAEDHPEFNSLLTDEEHAVRQYQDKTKQLRDMHLNVKDSYDRLYRITAKGPNSQEFIEPQVQRLWKQALEANFSNDELLSLKSEMLHYENRLLKLRHLHAEAEANAQKYRDKKEITKKPSEGEQKMEDSIKKTERKVEKLKLDLETRIMQKHIEL